MVDNKRNIAFIINPKSGTVRNKDLSGLINTTFAEQEVNITVQETQYAGHATALAKEYALKNYEAVVAVGGDGTVNETAQGLLYSNTALGIVPKGSGNGLARACKIPIADAKALAIIKKGYIRNIDVGKINEQLFLSNAGTGFDAHVAALCANVNKRGLLMYARTSIQAFNTYKSKQYTINIDGVEYTEKAIMVSIANGNEFGYGFKIAPNASIYDGKLDVVIIKPLNFINAGRVSFQAWWGNLLKYSKVIHKVGKYITITCNEDSTYQIDGDAKGIENKLDIQINNKALNVIVP
jgi:diacylglycerol kinase (ATP)